MKENIFYFDYASTTPVDSAVLKAMQPYFTKEFGNPSNLYNLGREAKRAVEKATAKITGVLNCGSDELIFTGSATEADNLAIAGAARANREAGNKIIISNIEHKAVLSVCKALAKEGFEIVELPVQKNGLVNPEELKNSLDKRTVLVSVMYANNEIGTIQPIAEIAKIIRNFREELRIKNKELRADSKFIIHNSLFPLFHTDAAQAPQFLDCDVNKLGVDLMTISSHKLYGPKGIGGLYVRRGVSLIPIIYGGGSGKSRPGTQNVAGIVGFGEAVALARKNKKAESSKLKKLRDKLEKGIFRTIPKVVLNGHPVKRLPNFLNISILDIEGEAILLRLDEKGIMVGTGSACNSENLEPSYVLTAIGNPYEYIHGSVRFTLGKYTKRSDVDYVLKTLPDIVKKLRRLSPINLELDKKETMSQPRAFISNQTPHF